MSRKYKKWTNEEDSLLEYYLTQNILYKEIASLLGRTTASITQRCKNRQISNNKCKKWTKEEDLILIDLVNKNITYKDIGKILYRSEQSIGQRCFQLKIQSNNNKSIKICPRCNNKIGINCKICYICGHKIDTTAMSLYEAYPELIQEWDFQRNTKYNPQYLYCYTHIKVYWICQIGHKYQAEIYNRTKNNSGCPYCSGRKTLKGFNDLMTTHPKLCIELVNSEDGYKYSFGSTKILQWQCKKCSHIWLASPNTRRNHSGTGCPKCSSSKGENKICDILDKYNISYIREKTFDKCVYISKLRFDFYLMDYNICIEFNRIQHYPEKYKKTQLASSHRHSKNDIDIIVKRDKIKQTFCKKQDIKLIYIPYWEFNNIESILQKELQINV